MTSADAPKKNGRCWLQARYISSTRVEVRTFNSLFDSVIARRQRKAGLKQAKGGSAKAAATGIDLQQAKVEGLIPCSMRR